MKRYFLITLLFITASTSIAMERWNAFRRQRKQTHRVLRPTYYSRPIMWFAPAYPMPTIMYVIIYKVKQPNDNPSSFVPGLPTQQTTTRPKGDA